MINNLNVIGATEAILWQLPSIITWKDTNSVYLGCNKNHADLVGYKNIDSIVGKKDSDLPCEAAKFYEIFKQQDKEARSKPQVILDIHRYADGEMHQFITQKIPLMDNTGCIVGSTAHMFEINIPLINKLANIISNGPRKNLDVSNSFLISDSYKDYNLSKRESECLYYLLRGKTAKEIAKFLNISPRTVEDYIFKVKLKFSCQSKYELISKAMNEGFLAIIPTNLLPDSLSKYLIFDK